MTRTITTDDGTTTAVARAFLKWQYKQPRVALMLSFFLLLSVIYGSQKNLTILWVLVIVLIIGVSPLLAYRRLKKTFSQNVAKPGSAISVSAGKEDLTIKTPQGTSTTKFSAYERVSIQDEFVILKTKGRIGLILPRQLLPSEDIAKIQAGIIQGKK